MAILKTLTINGVTYTVAPMVLVSNVILRASAWEGSEGAYSQVVEVAGVNSSSKVDLQPTPEQLVEFHDKDLTFTTENDGGVVTVYAVGDKPTDDYTVQVTIKEVVA